LPRDDLFEAEAKLFRLVAFNVQLPVLTGALADVDDQIGFARSLKAKVQIVAHHPAVDAHDAIARLEFQLSAQASGGDF
jgi:hypothetical protein